MQRRHKHCAKLLRSYYDCQREELLQYYEDLCSWLNIPPLAVTSPKMIADAFHFHIKKAGITIREHDLLPKIKTRDNDKPLSDALPISIYLDNLRSAHNVGSIIRTTDALGLGKVFFSARTPSPNCKQAKDAAMGAEEWIQWFPLDSIDRLPRPLIVLETAEEAPVYYDFTFPETFTLVIGNEEYGCCDAILRSADQVIQIPMHGRKNSLNVANAYAIIAAEIRRQHHQGRV